MGGANKLALPVDGEPLLRRVVRTLLGSRLQELVIVFGHEADRAERLLAGLDVHTVRNAGYAEGQMSSVHCGLAALVAPCTGIMICLADQPLLTPADIDRLIDAFGARRRGSILAPTHQGRRGNPIILAAEHRAAILRAERNLGCRRLIERNPELVATVESVNDHTVFDLDTPEDYRRLQQRLNEAGATTAPSAPD